MTAICKRVLLGSLLLLFCAMTVQAGVAGDIDLTPQQEAILNQNIVGVSHRGGADPKTEGFTVSPPTHPDGFGFRSDSDGNPDANGGYWGLKVDPAVSATLQRYQGPFDVPDSGAFTISAMGAIFQNARSATPESIDPTEHGNTMVVSLDIQVDGPTITGVWNEVAPQAQSAIPPGAQPKIFAGNSPHDFGQGSVENINFVLQDMSDVTLYQWFVPNDGQNLADLYVNGVLAIDDMDYSVARTGLDGNEGWLWGSVTRGGGQNSLIKSLSAWSRLQVQSGYTIIPEPTTVALLGLAGLMAVVGRRRR